VKSEKKELNKKISRAFPVEVFREIVGKEIYCDKFCCGKNLSLDKERIFLYNWRKADRTVAYLCAERYRYEESPGFTGQDNG